MYSRESCPGWIYLMLKNSGNAATTGPTTQCSTRMIRVGCLTRPNGSCGTWELLARPTRSVGYSANLRVQRTGARIPDLLSRILPSRRQGLPATRP